MAMTVEDLKTYYSELLIKQYYSKTNAVAEIKAVTEEFVCNLLPITIRDAFNITTAVGEQLEWIAKYVGLTRVVIYNGTQYTLTDAEMRRIIPFLAIKLNSRSTYKEIVDMMYLLEPDTIRVFDSLTMKLTYYVIDTENDFIKLLAGIDALPRPMGVALYPIISLPSFDNIFSFRTYTRAAPANTYGFSTYVNLPNDSRWLSYSDILV